MGIVMEKDWMASGDSPASVTSGWGVYASMTFMLAVASPLAPASDAGSGGMMTADALKARPAWISTDSSSAEVERVDVRHFSSDASATLQQRLQTLKTTLGLTITDMAELFGVARPSIYAWLKGQEPRPDNVERLATLESYAEKVDALALPRVDKLIKRPLKSGASMLLLIKDGRAVDRALDELAHIARTEHDQRMNQKGRNKLWTAREAADYVSSEGVEKDS
ncbi:MAG TPA: helix-turn-helix domain-containing protein [Alcanivorax sp.]|jgi:transcriptional regulator with XRE-family HTH domain|nr:hypothetical protein [Alcanivorax sp.]HIK73599.1 helix-turn-helix domain-containing protein [Alcanivorax sp.]